MQSLTSLRKLPSRQLQHQVMLLLTLPYRSAWIVYMTLMFLVLFIPPLETALWFARAMHPWTHLGLQIFKTGFWALYLILAITTMAMKPVLKYEQLWALWKIWLMVGIALNLVCCIGALVYGAVVLRRWRRVERAYERLEEPAVKAGGPDRSSSTDALVS